MVWSCHGKHTWASALSHPWPHRVQCVWLHNRVPLTYEGTMDCENCGDPHCCEPSWIVVCTRCGSPLVVLKVMWYIVSHTCTIWSCLQWSEAHLALEQILVCSACLFSTCIVSHCNCLFESISSRLMHGTTLPKLLTHPSTYCIWITS